MNISQCTYEKIFDRFIGGVIFAISGLFLAISATVLPLVGLLLALPIMGLSVAFFNHTPSEVCLIKE